MLFILERQAVEVSEHFTKTPNKVFLIYPKTFLFAYPSIIFSYPPPAILNNQRIA